MQEYVEGWLDARDDVWDEGQPHTEASYAAYPRWYFLRMRPYVTLSRIDDAEHQHQPTISDTYPSYRDQEQRGAIDLIKFAEIEATSQITLHDRGVRVPEAQYKDSLRKIQDSLTRALRALTCRGRDDVGASSSSHASAHVYAAGPSSSAALHAASSGTAASSSFMHSTAMGPPPARMEPQTFGAYAPGTSLPSRCQLHQLHRTFRAMLSMHGRRKLLHTVVHSVCRTGTTGRAAPLLGRSWWAAAPSLTSLVHPRRTTL
ncbi:uncharacterized protein LOC112891044 [Panicum hallii]|uniref:uncharacterized protein LOC112891044 n=1 Tax=Panicum hallii TaxID=206008 RepID=UPI000DF4DD5C|nr:uncharacterized protein LOC112891044 [Panicum hallii]